MGNVTRFNKVPAEQTAEAELLLIPTYSTERKNSRDIDREWERETEREKSGAVAPLFRDR